jgi:hypothetical protein
MLSQIVQSFRVVAGPRIEQNGAYGWYVVVTIEDGYTQDYYLHKDLKWRLNTDHCGRYNGYFQTKQDAEKALEKYILGA